MGRTPTPISVTVDPIMTLFSNPHEAGVGYSSPDEEWV